MSKISWLLVFCMLLPLTLFAQDIGPWDLDSLYQVPVWDTTSVASSDGLTGIIYESSDYNDAPVKVFAYYGVPDGNMPDGGWPAVVYVHGGGGTASPEWVKSWNAHGYAALSMDLEGHYPIGPFGSRPTTENPGPERIGNFNDWQLPVEEQWYYHAVSQVIIGHSLLRSFPEVNADKTGMVGVSWGGILVSTVMGIDSRCNWAIPVYGSGYLSEMDTYMGASLQDAKADFVNTNYDGSAYFNNVTCPTLWVNGTNDIHFAMTGTQKSFQSVQGPATLRYTLRMPHGHTPAMNFEELYTFADHVVNGAEALPVLSEPVAESNTASVSFSSDLTVTSAKLLYTLDDSTWSDRYWNETNATISGDTISAEIPEDATTIYFTATDSRGLMVSSEYLELPKSLGPWKAEALFQTPDYETTTLAPANGLTSILYRSVDYKGDTVKVFAYYGVPEGNMPDGGWPAVVYVHGGGGTASAEWVKSWNDHGFAALSMDTEGHYPLKDASGVYNSTPNPGPSRYGVWNDYALPIDEQWYYHAVSQVIKGHSLLRSFPEVNPNKTGIIGVSWGGTITSTVMGVDNRFKFAIPVYGAGYLSESDGFQGVALYGPKADTVNTYYDGSLYFSNVTYPTLWINGTNDYHFAMTCTQQSSQAVEGPATLRYTLRMPHGHYTAMRLDEVYAFADQAVNEASALPELSAPVVDSNTGSVTFSTDDTIVSAQLLYTQDKGIWSDRYWYATSATVSGNTISAELPEEVSTIYFTATDSRGLMVSSEYLEVSKQPATGGNLALSGTATQSSTDYGADASRAIDGDTNGKWSGGSITHTLNQGEDNPWWQVDLGDDMIIDSIMIWNRTDLYNTGNSLGDRLSNFTIQVFDNLDSPAVFTDTIVDSYPDPTYTTLTNGIQGRYVKIQLTEFGILSLAEVQVFGKIATIINEGNLAVAGTATQSTVDYDGEPERAIDGNTSGVYGEGSVTHTIGSGENNPWWQVDLGREASIDSITIWNRTDECCVHRLSNFTIQVFDNLDSAAVFTDTIVDSFPDPSYTTLTSGINGRYVKVQLTEFGVLSLAEVQVFGKIATDINDGPGIGAQTPDKFNLYQNYPNPFNPNTRIRFNLPEAAEVKLTVYDIQGRKIKTMIQGSVNAGIHNVEWNATNDQGQRVPSGAYFYSIKVNGKKLKAAETGKMILMK